MNLSKKIRVIAALGTLSAGVWAGTFAAFTDSSVGTSTFSSGTVDIGLDNDTTDAYTFATLTTANMKPGQAATYAALPVKNLGSLAFGYTMATAADNADTKGLRTQLRYGVRGLAAGLACDATNYAASLDVRVTEGALDAAATTASKAVAAGASDLLCFKIELPSTVTDTYQGASTTATLTFSATQS